MKSNVIRISKKDLHSIYRCKVCGAYLEVPIHCGVPCDLLLDGRRRVMLSKLLSALLRHIPHEAGISLNRGGWVNIRELVSAIKQRWRNKELYSWLTEEHVIAVASLDPKGRFEIKDDYIRAKYGHSIHVDISLPEDNEVQILYHGTQLRNLKSILSEGIKPMKRVKVHLTKSIEEAMENALRKGRAPVILVIDANELRQHGHKVFKAGKNVYVTDYVPPLCIKRVITPQVK